MKISKLFHWLYACVMLAPIFAVIGGVAYTVFNKNAKDNYSGNTNEYELIQTDVSNFVPNNEYLFISSNITNPSLTNQGVLDINVSNVKINNTLYDTIDLLRYYPIDNSDAFYLQLRNVGTNTSIYTYNLHTTPITFTFNYVNRNSNLYLDFLDNYFFTERYLGSTLDNAFYYGMDKMANNDLFKWASNSFLSQPITYVTGLFNMPNDSPFILLMSYWLNISIIWLTFDLIMYVPLLVHRWIDKGVLE